MRWQLQDSDNGFADHDRAIGFGLGLVREVHPVLGEPRGAGQRGRLAVRGPAGQRVRFVDHDPGRHGAAGGTRPTIPAQYQAAFTACASDRPTGGFGGGEGGGFNSTAFTAYRNCLEVHGVTLPTTPTTTPGETPRTGWLPGAVAASGGSAGC